MSDVKYPDILVELSGQDGNALFIIGRTRRAMREAGVSNDECNSFSKDAMSGDYDHVLQTVMRWVETS